jgi:hypothetical protein
MFSVILDIVKKAIPDANEAEKTARLLETEHTKQMELKTSIIKKEMSQGGITSKWRPYTMMLFVGMVFVHWFMYDVMKFATVAFDLDLWIPEDPGFTAGLLDLIEIGLGGYIAGRTIEKGLRIWKS